MDSIHPSRQSRVMDSHRDERINVDSFGRDVRRMHPVSTAAAYSHEPLENPMESTALRMKRRDEVNIEFWPASPPESSELEEKQKSKKRKKAVESDDSSSSNDSEASSDSDSDLSRGHKKQKKSSKHRKSKRSSSKAKSKAKSKSKSKSKSKAKSKSKKSSSKSKSHRKTQQSSEEDSDSSNDSRDDEVARGRPEGDELERKEAEEFWQEKPVVNDDTIEGPLPAADKDMKLDARAYGGQLLAGEGSAIAAYVQSGKRIPRRGEIGLTADEIQAYEDVGFVMSGSRHTRMNAVRIRKENQVITAEEKNALLMFAQQEKLRKETETVALLKEMVANKVKSVNPQ